MSEVSGKARTVHAGSTHEIAYGLVSLSATSKAPLILCNTCYCAGTNATTPLGNHNDEGLDEAQRATLFAAEYFLQQVISSIDDIALVSRLLTALEKYLCGSSLTRICRASQMCKLNLFVAEYGVKDRVRPGPTFWVTYA